MLLPGDYTKNLCDPSDTLCTPCTKRFPSCKGLPDGKSPSPGPLWAQGYIVCEKGRTLSVEKCEQGQHFNPRTKSCETHVAPGFGIDVFLSRAVNHVTFVIFILSPRCGFVNFHAQR